MNYKIIVFMLLIMVMNVYSKSLKITRDGEAAAEIIVDLNAHPTINLAARELQLAIKNISNARVSILNAPLEKKYTHIFLGTVNSPLFKKVLLKYPEDENKLLKNDGYAVRTIKNDLYIFAVSPRGVLNGVHRFILRNTDLIWIRPYGELAVCSKQKDLNFSQCNYIDIPKFLVRGWSANRSIQLHSEEFELLCSRLCNNLTFSIKTPALGRRLEHSFILDFGAGHNIGKIWLPVKTYGKEHPEYYMLVNGKRRSNLFRTHPCLSNQEMRQEFIANALRVASKVPNYFKRLNIMIEDTPAVCECEECEKPIVLPDGKTITKNDEAFHSTRFFIFLNEVAQAIYAKYPQFEIKAFAYFFTAIPPKVKLFKTINIAFCPFVRNDKRPLSDVSNAKWLKRIKEWSRLTPNLMWREYYYSMAAFPRAQGNVIAQDLRLINKLGVKQICPEISWGDRSGYTTHNAPEHEFWDLNAPEFWTITQLMWDPAQDPDYLRNEFIKRAYKEGAAGVSKFYAILRDSWLLDPAPSTYNDDFRKSMGRYIVFKKLAEQCFAALNEAKSAVKNPHSKALLDRLFSTFSSWVDKAASGKLEEQIIPKADVRKFPGFDFNAPPWNKAAKLSPLRKMGNPDVQAPDITEIKVMHNNEKLFVAWKCEVNAPLEAKSNLPHDAWPGGDHAEMFFSHPSGYVHFAFDCNENRYEGLLTDSSWNAPWEVRTQKNKGYWLAVAEIPLSSIGATIQQNNRIKALFYCCRPGKNGVKNRHSSWGGGNVHSIDGFGELIFNLE